MPEGPRTEAPLAVAEGPSGGAREAEPERDLDLEALGAGVCAAVPEGEALGEAPAAEGEGVPEALCDGVAVGEGEAVALPVALPEAAAEGEAVPLGQPEGVPEGVLESEGVLVGVPLQEPVPEGVLLALGGLHVLWPGGLPGQGRRVQGSCAGKPGQ